MPASAFGCRVLLAFWLVVVAGCDSGSSSPPQPVAATPAPAPTPDPPLPPQQPPNPPPQDPPSPPPPSDDSIPPLASVAISVTDNHQVGSTYWPDGNTSTGGYGNQVQGLRCGDMVETYHVHTHLSFFLNGDQLALPTSVGNVSPRPGTSCYYPLHTHDRSGKVHVEATAPGVFTLGQFFAIWGQPLEPANVAGHTGLPVVVYLVDENKASRYEGDLKAIELESHRGIVVQIGTTIAEIPRYSWFGE